MKHFRFWPLATCLLVSGPVLASADLDEVTHRMDMLPEVYGQISLVMEHNHTNDGVTGGKSRFKDNESFLGVRNQHEIVPGLDAFFRAEWWFDADNDDDSFQNLEYAYIGVEGDFGRVWGGTDDTVYEQHIDHIANFFESEFRNGGETRNLPGAFDTGRGNLLQYSSPGRDGWQFHGAMQFNEDGDEDMLEEQGKTSRPFQLVSSYQSGNWEYSFGLDSNENGKGPDNTTIYGARATYDSNNWSLTTQYQYRDDVADVFGMLGTYHIGRTQYAFAYERERDRVEGRQLTHAYTVQFLHNLSERFRVYVEGHQAEPRKTAHRRDLMIGAAYRF